MVGNRLKIIVKWAIFLTIVSIAIGLLATFLVAILMGLVVGSENFDQELAGTEAGFLGSLLSLPFVYVFCLKAAKEAYQKKLLGPKQKGINTTGGVVVVTILIGIILEYLLTGGFDIKFGILPIFLAFKAGQKADKLYASK